MQFDDVSLKRLTVTPLKRAKPNRFTASTIQRLNAFAWTRGGELPQCEHD